ncbi:D-hexose-6-phosphate mutarotase [Streptomyces sp. NPDC048603]|uniref:D-hexose-6-phosphate mutarotase n=1 Tax=Streptomyces sp. NPDC048603 TaxID=3365577 RepID=UPI0037204B4A
MSKRIFDLPVGERLSASVGLRKLGDLPVVVVDHPRIRGAVTLQGAQLLLWQQAGEEPVLWLSEEARYAEGAAVRGGVPVCWPWFGAAGEPAHGFARILPWELTGVEEGEDLVVLTLTLRDDARTRALWPYAFTLTARIELGAGHCTVGIEAEGDHRTTGALHTYLGIGELGRAEVTGVGEPFADRLRDGEQGRQEGPFTPAGHVERLWPEPGPVSRVTDRVLGRTVEVEHRGHSDVLVWNPGPELARGMTDVADDGYRTFLCVETARISEPLVATAGAPSRLAVTLRVVRQGMSPQVFLSPGRGR